jgi:hypothetical protein
MIFFSRRSVFSRKVRRGAKRAKGFRSAKLVYCGNADDADYDDAHDFFLAALGFFLAKYAGEQSAQRDFAARNWFIVGTQMTRIMMMRMIFFSRRSFFSHKARRGAKHAKGFRCAKLVWMMRLYLQMKLVSKRTHFRLPPFHFPLDMRRQ